MNAFDAHCHLSAAGFDDDRAEVIARAIDRGVARMHVPGYDPSAWSRVERADGALHARFGVGLHPWWVHEATDEALEEALGWLDDVVRTHDVASIGETGLDRFGVRAASIARQTRAFTHQVALAHTAGLPLALHVVAAHGQAVARLAAERRVITGYVHGFSGAPEVARQYVALGLCISFGAAIMHDRTRHARASAAVVPDTHLLVETDAPDGRFAAGVRAEPSALVGVIETLAHIRGASVAHVTEVTAHNAARLFGPR